MNLGISRTLGKDPSSIPVITPSFFMKLEEIPIDKSRLASLINASWNPLVEWLKRLDALRECVQRRPGTG